MKMLHVFGLLLCVSLFPDPVMAFGSKPAAPPATTQAWPTRDVAFATFLSTPFLLPDGKTKVDMSVELPNLMYTEMTQQAQGKLRVIDPTVGPSGSQPRFLLKGGVTAFEANNFTNSITIGFKPGAGDIGSGTIVGASGALTFSVGTLDMNFYIVDTQTQEVVAVGAGSALTGGVTVNVSLDFSVIQTADQFVYTSQMAPLFKKAVDAAIDQMVNDPNTNLQMDWTAQVSNVIPSASLLQLNAGARDAIQPNNVFSVYDNHNMLLGEVKVDSTDTNTSNAAFENDSDNKLLNSVKTGDSVKIYFFHPPK